MNLCLGLTRNPLSPDNECPKVAASPCVDHWSFIAVTADKRYCSLFTVFYTITQYVIWI